MTTEFSFLREHFHDNVEIEPIRGNQPHVDEVAAAGGTRAAAVESGVALWQQLLLAQLSWQVWLLLVAAVAAGEEEADSCCRLGTKSIKGSNGLEDKKIRVNIFMLSSMVKSIQLIYVDLP